MLDVFPYEPQRRFVNQRTGAGPDTVPARQPLQTGSANAVPSQVGG
jgi:hypothetical protein